jgi:hypothetical protein
VQKKLVLVYGPSLEILKCYQGYQLQPWGGWGVIWRALFVHTERVNDVLHGLTVPIMCCAITSYDDTA